MSSEELKDKKVYADRVKRSAKQSGVVMSFQRTSSEEWGFSNEKNHFSKMTTFEKWNSGDGQRGIMPSIKKGIIRYEKSARSSFNYDFSQHAKARLLCNYLLTKTIYFFREMAMVVEDLYHQLCLKLFDSRSPNKEARATCYNIVTTLLVCLFDELCSV